MRAYLFIISVVLLLLFASGLNGGDDPPALLLRLDDSGMNHSVNMAIKQVAETGVPFSTSVMFVCPWYQEAVATLKQFPGVSVGVHLVLNSEWKYYKWGPVLGRTAAPSLVDSDGYFFPSTETFLASHYRLGEVEKELTRADRARHPLRVEDRLRGLPHVDCSCDATAESDRGKAREEISAGHRKILR